MRKFIYIILAIILLTINSNTFANAVKPMSSWVLEQFYIIEWCSPHAGKTYMDSSILWTSNCTKWYFHDVWWIAKIVYNWKDFSNWNITTKDDTIKSTRTAKTINDGALEVVDFFTKNIINIQSEWIIKVKAIVMDYANNVSTYDFIYKIDKTAPQFYINSVDWITENTNFTYYNSPNWKLNLTKSVNKYDSLNVASSWEKYNESYNISKYTWDTPQITNIHSRSWIHTLYFSRTWNNFSINTTSNDIIWWLKTDIVSWASTKYELLTLDWTKLKSFNSLSSLSTSDLTSNTDNSQIFYKLRLYDNTVWKNWWPWNYSETIIYAVKDNTPPNMWNGITENQAIENILSFNDSKTVYDKTIPWYNPKNVSLVSRFLAADNSLELKYSLNDLWITWTNCSSFINCNAWLLTDNSVYIDSADNNASQKQTISLYSDRFNTNWSKNIDFSKVDNALNSKGTYRYYNTLFKSTQWDWKICDLVGNCITPQLKFRVVANKMDLANSKLTLSSTAQKIFADLQNWYNLVYNLLDKYWNKVVPILSLENWNISIKDITTTLNFHNWLNSNQRTNTPSWNKLAYIENKETDDKAWVFNNSEINNSWIIQTKEDPDKMPNWKYSFYIKSQVPTKEFYPYLSDNSYLSVDSIKNESTILNDTNKVFNWNNLLWDFNIETNITGTWKFVNADTWWLKENENDKYNLVLNDNNYWISNLVSAVDVAFSNLSTRKLNLPFASPLLFWYNNYIAISNNEYMKHAKLLYNFSSSNLADYNVYEKNLLCESSSPCKDTQYWSNRILDFYLRSSSETSQTWVLVNNWTILKSAITWWIIQLFNNVNNSSLVFKGELLTTNPSDKKAEIWMKVLNNHLYDMSKIKTWLATWLYYKLISATNYIYLPSIWRGLTWEIWDTQFDKSRNYFSDSYTLWWSNSSMIANLSDIAIVWLYNNWKKITTEVNNTKAWVKVEWWITRYDLLKTFQKNISNFSSWLQSKNYTGINKKWCSSKTISSLNTNNSEIIDCTMVIDDWKEIVTYIDWDLTIKCNSWSNWNTCILPKNIKRTIIVKNGYLYIKSDISSKAWGQLLLWSITDNTLWNVTINQNTPNLTDFKWWMLINPEVTNIDSYLVSKWPIISYNWTKLYSGNNTQEWDLRNQLHIYWSVLSLNNVGWSINWECPYIINNCNTDTSKIFDLTYLRRFFLVDKSVFTDSKDLTWWSSVPYNPNWWTISKKSWWLTWTNYNCSSSELRCLQDSDYYPYPTIIQKDPIWTTSQSKFFE